MFVFFIMMLKMMMAIGLEDVNLGLSKHGTLYHCLYIVVYCVVSNWRLNPYEGSSLKTNKQINWKY